METVSLIHNFHEIMLTNRQLKHYKVPVIGGRDCAKVTRTPAHLEKWSVGSIQITALHTPCHTQDSICYFFQDGDDRAVFTGDTLFIGGMFECSVPGPHGELESIGKKDNADVTLHAKDAGNSSRAPRMRCMQHSTRAWPPCQTTQKFM